jgi:hypothetical protein
LSITRFIRLDFLHNKRSLSDARSKSCSFASVATATQIILATLIQVSVLAVDDRHVAFCEYNGSVARIICVAVATLANEQLLERASDNDLHLY